MLKLSRNFTIGRQTEQLYSDELYRLYQLLKNIDAGYYMPEDTPDGEFHGALWLNMRENSFYAYDEERDEWRILFDKKFVTLDNLISTEPDNTRGQLWIDPYGRLNYHDGMQYVPVKANIAEPAEYSVGSFVDFLLVSPLYPTGNKIVLEGHQEPKMQFLVPNVNTVRVFNRGSLETSSIPLNQLTMQYDIQDILDIYTIEFPEEKKDAYGDPEGDPYNYYEIYDLSHTDVTGFVALNVNGATYAHSTYVEFDEATQKLTFKFMELRNSDLVQVIHSGEEPFESYMPHIVHINPSRLTNINKKLFMIDPASGFVDQTPLNTEFYLFRAPQNIVPEETTGIFLEEKYYKKESDHIYLKHEKIEDELGKYDFLLAIEYEFAWFYDKGTMSTVYDTDEQYYHIPEEKYPFILFKEGNLVNRDNYEYYSDTQVLKVKDKDDNIGILNAETMQEGYITTTDKDGEGELAGVISLHTPVKNPLVFIDGFLIPSEIYEHDGGQDEPIRTIMIRDIPVPSSYTIMDMGNRTVSEGYVEGDYISCDITGEIALFLNGNLVSSEDFSRDQNNNIVSDKLSEGDHYFILELQEDQLDFSLNKIGAFAVDYDFDESLVYLNGRIVCNNTIIDRDYLQDPAHNVIQRTLDSDGELQVYRYDATRREDQGWEKLPDSEKVYIENLASAYKNDSRTITFGFVNTDIEEYEVGAYLFSYTGGPSNTIRLDTIYIPEETNKVAKVYHNVNVEEITHGYENNSLIMDTIKEKLYRFHGTRTYLVTEEDVDNNLLFLNDHDNKLYNLEEDELKETPPDYLLLEPAEKTEELFFIEVKDIVEELDKEYDSSFYAFLRDDSLYIKLSSELYYVPNYNAISLYLDGVRQYVAEEALNGRGMKLPVLLDCYATFVIETPDIERSKTKTVITENDLEKIEGYPGLYIVKSNKSLYPGHIRVFLDGLRQSPSNYRIVDKNKIEFKFPELDNNKILIEITDDYNIRERTTKLKSSQEARLDIGKNEDVPVDIKRTQDKVLIYTGGVLYNTKDDSDYLFSESAISLDNAPFNENLKTGEQIIVEWRS